jgi:hypothetical protein
VAAVASVFSEHPFRRVSPTEEGVVWDSNVNRAVFDIQMLVMEGMDVMWLRANGPGVVAAFRELCLDDSKFADALSRATADKSRFDRRVRTWSAKLKELGAEVPCEHRVPQVQEHED